MHCRTSKAGAPGGATEPQRNAFPLAAPAEEHRQHPPVPPGRRPARADDELALAQQLLSGPDLRATTLTTLTTQIAALVRDAGTTQDVEDRTRLLRTDIDVAGLASAGATLDLALCFHHAVQNTPGALAATIARLRERTHTGDHAYYADIAHFMATLPAPSPAQWLNGEQTTRDRWHALVTARREHLRTAQ